MKKLIVLLLTALSITANAEISAKAEADLVKNLLIGTFGEGNYEGSVLEKRVKASVANVKGICGSETLRDTALKAVTVQGVLVKDGYFVSTLEVIEALGTLKRQAPEDFDCLKVVSDYATVVKQAPTPAEALASVNSLYKILKSKTK